MNYNSAITYPLIIEKITMNYIKNTTATKLALGVITMSFAFLGMVNMANASSCDFNRTLKEGIEGQDVRCLQKYLNTHGYTIASTGVGSFGR